MSKKATKKTAGKSITGWVTQWVNPLFLEKVWIGAEDIGDLERAFRRATSAGSIFDPKKCTKAKVTKL